MVVIIPIFFYSRRTPINYLLVNLAVVDTIYSAFYIPKIILNFSASIHPEGVAGKVLCTLLTDRNVGRVGAISSIITLVAIAIERYYAVVFPLGNRGKLTMNKLKVCYWVKAMQFYR